MSGPPQDVRVGGLTRGRARWVAVGLFAFTVGLLLLTTGMGYTRDESFYFRYAQSYQEWFVALEDADTQEEVQALFERERLIRTWAGNMEHPPLMKAAFGWSWRAFGRKDRRLRVPRTTDGKLTVRVDPADGFAVGASVDLLRPLAPGASPTGSERVLAQGTVVERALRRAVVTIDPVDMAEVLATCVARAGDTVAADPGPRWVTGCQAREDRAWAVFDEATALRLPAILSSGLAVSFTFLLGVELFGWIAGLFGALAFLFVPRHFFHAHLCCFDMPIVAASVMTLYAFWRSQSDRRWALYTAIFWGVALLVKHNAFFLPVSLVFFWLWAGRDMLSAHRRGWRVWLNLPRLPLALLTMPVVGVAMLFTFWPKLWYDPMRAIWDYFAFHLHHEHYMQWYFGEPLQVPPFPVDFPFTLTAITVPEVFLLLFVVGALVLAPPTGWWRWLKGVFTTPVSPTEKAAAFALVTGLVPIVVIALPSTPIFGGIKHWMTGMPMLLIVAGVAVQAMVRALPRPRVVAPVALVAILSAPAYASIAAVPYGTGYYNRLAAGGLQGAADRQMMRVYWGHTGVDAIPWINAHARPGARIFYQNTTVQAFEMYQAVGLLREDLRYAYAPPGDIAVIEPQRAFSELELDVRRRMGVAGPTVQYRHEGVPFLKIYTRRDRLPAAAQAKTVAPAVAPTAVPATALPVPRAAPTPTVESPQGPR